MFYVDPLEWLKHDQTWPADLAAAELMLLVVRRHLEQSRDMRAKLVARHGEGSVVVEHFDSAESRRNPDLSNALYMLAERLDERQVEY